MLRRRQVRFCYPQALVTIALMLCGDYKKREVARALDLPLSTIYRWIEDARGASDPVGTLESGRARTLADLVAQCEQHGFKIDTGLATLGLHLAPSAVGVPNSEPGHAPDLVLTSTQDARGTANAVRRPPFSPLLGMNFVAGTDSIRGTDMPRAAAKQPRSSLAMARILAARNEIDTRYYSALSCEHLAQIAGLSRFHFIKRFKSICGSSPYRYLMQVRIRHAKYLLGNTTQTLDTIASAVGFDTPACFNKAFIAIEGSSVSKFYRGVRLGWTPLAHDNFRIASGP